MILSYLVCVCIIKEISNIATMSIIVFANKNQNTAVSVQVLLIA